jgi:hypothetical protein
MEPTVGAKRRLMAQSGVCRPLNPPMIMQSKPFPDFASLHPGY